MPGSHFKHEVSPLLSFNLKCKLKRLHPCRYELQVCNSGSTLEVLRRHRSGGVLSHLPDMVVPCSSDHFHTSEDHFVSRRASSYQSSFFYRQLFQLQLLGITTRSMGANASPSSSSGPLSESLSHDSKPENQFKLAKNRNKFTRCLGI